MAMKRTFPIAVLLAALCGVTLGAINLMLDAPRDDRRARLAVGARAELKPLSDQYLQLIEARIYPLTLAQVANIFGPKIERRPDDLVLPICDPGGRLLSGLRHTDPALNKDHTDLHAIGHLGYIEIYYAIDGESIATAAFYERADGQFVPLKTASDFSRRLRWERAKFGKIRKWLEEHLPKSTDLGGVEVSASSPTRVSLGRGKSCIITTEVLTRPGMSNEWFSLRLTLDSQNADAGEQPVVYKNMTRPWQSVGFCFDGQFYRLTPKLKSK